MTRVLIQAVPWVPSRAVNAARLMQAIDGEIVWDKNYSALDTYLALLERAGNDAIIMLEDDVILTSNWRDKIEAAIAEHPTSVIRFFSTKHQDVWWPSRWMDGKDYYCNLCTYLPEGYAKKLRTWIGDRRPRHFLDLHDSILGHWLHSRGEQFWHYSPSLVQHMEGESVVKPLRGQRRKSKSFQP